MCDCRSDFTVAAGVPGPRFTKIRKSYKFVRPIVLHRLNEFVEQKSFVRNFVKRAPDPWMVQHLEQVGRVSVCDRVEYQVLCLLHDNPV